MTTKKNLVKNVLMSMLTAGMFTMCFTSCSDEIESEIKELNNVEAQAQVNNGPLQNLEQHSYVVPFEVRCNGEWRIEFEFDEASC